VLLALTVTVASNFWPGSSVPTFQTSGFGPLFCAGTALTNVTPLGRVSVTFTLVMLKACRLYSLTLYWKVSPLLTISRVAGLPAARQTFILTSVGS